MILPKGKHIYENLNTSFTDFEKLLADLKHDRLTGAVQVVFWDFEGILFLDAGTIVNASAEIDGAIKVAQEALNALLKKVKEKDGTISVYSLPADLVTLLASSTNREVLHKELDSDFTNLEKLLEKLRDIQHSGYLEIVTTSGVHQATIFFQGGEPLKSILSLNAETVVKSGIHTQIAHLAREKGMLFNVYRAGIGSMAGNQLSENDAVAVLNFWAQALSIAEKRYPPGKFMPFFKQLLIEKADRYPFLDPFVDDFQYTTGKIKFKGNISPDFNKGLIELLTELLKRFSDITINNELQKLIDIHHGVMEKYSLESAIYKLFR